MVPGHPVTSRSFVKFVPPGRRITSISIAITQTIGALTWSDGEKTREKGGPDGDEVPNSRRCGRQEVERKGWLRSEPPRRREESALSSRSTGHEMWTADTTIETSKEKRTPRSRYAGGRQQPPYPRRSSRLEHHGWNLNHHRKMRANCGLHPPQLRWRKETCRAFPE